MFVYLTLSRAGKIVVILRL